MYLRTNKVKNGAKELFALCKESFAGKVRDLRQEFFVLQRAETLHNVTYLQK